jgi:hypothetical protein
MATNKKTEKAIVEESPNLVRDMSTNAIINTDRSGFEQRLTQIAKQQQQAEIDAKQREDIDSLKKDMAEIKKLLKGMASK